jgi:hypothetical protein
MLLTPIPFEYARLLTPGDRTRRAGKQTPARVRRRGV